VLRPLGFTQVEAERIFNYLDGLGGCRHHPPATINLSDFAWLLRLPALVNLSPAFLGKAGDNTDLARLSRRHEEPQPAAKGTRALSPPAALLGRHSRLSVMSQEDAEAAFPQRAGRRSQSPASPPPLTNRDTLRAVSSFLPANLQLEGDTQTSGQPAGQRSVMPLPLPLPDSSPRAKPRGDSEVASPPVARNNSDSAGREQLAAKTSSLRESPSQRSLGIASGPNGTQRAPAIDRVASQRSLGNLAGRGGNQSSASLRDVSPSSHVFGTAAELQSKGSTSTLPGRGKTPQAAGRTLSKQNSSLQGRSTSQQSVDVVATEASPSSSSVQRGASQKSIDAVATEAKPNSSSSQRDPSQKSLGANSGSGGAQSTSSSAAGATSQKPAEESALQAEAISSAPLEDGDFEEEDPSEDEEDEEELEGMSELERAEQERDVAGGQEHGVAEDSDGTTF